MLETVSKNWGRWNIHSFRKCNFAFPIRAQTGPFARMKMYVVGIIGTTCIASVSLPLWLVWEHVKRRDHFLRPISVDKSLPMLIFFSSESLSHFREMWWWPRNPITSSRRSNRYMQQWRNSGDYVSFYIILVFCALYSVTTIRKLFWFEIVQKWNLKKFADPKASGKSRFTLRLTVKLRTRWWYGLILFAE